MTNGDNNFITLFVYPNGQSVNFMYVSFDGVQGKKMSRDLYLSIQFKQVFFSDKL